MLHLPYTNFTAKHEKYIQQIVYKIDILTIPSYTYCKCTKVPVTKTNKQTNSSL